MNVADVLVDGFGRIREVARSAVEGLSADQLAERLDGQANSIAWLVWHLARVQDDHLADLTGDEQVWTADGWDDRFGFPFDASDIGYGHTSDDVAAVRVESAELLTGYLDAVHDQTVAWVGKLKESDLDKIVDDRWDPPVTLAARLVSVLSDDLQHAGQAAFIRGILLRR
jgi:uncharacterized damage-inducible protein DinB